MYVYIYIYTCLRPWMCPSCGKFIPPSCFSEFVQRVDQDSCPYVRLHLRALRKKSSSACKHFWRHVLLGAMWPLQRLSLANVSDLVLERPQMWSLRTATSREPPAWATQCMLPDPPTIQPGGLHFGHYIYGLWCGSSYILFPITYWYGSRECCYKVYVLDIRKYVIITCTNFLEYATLTDRVQNMVCQSWVEWKVKQQGTTRIWITHEQIKTIVNMS